MHDEVNTTKAVLTAEPRELTNEMTHRKHELECHVTSPPPVLGSYIILLGSIDVRLHITSNQPQEVIKSMLSVSMKEEVWALTYPSWCKPLQGMGNL